jgi:phosphonate transport system permease protein
MRYALASLILPGLGQLLRGRYARGLGLFGLTAVMVGLGLWAVAPPSTVTESAVSFKGDPNSWLWLVFPALVWLWTIWDAATPTTPTDVSNTKWELNRVKSLTASTPPFWGPLASAVVMFSIMGWQASGIDLLALAQNFDRAMLVLRPMFQPDFLQPRAELREGWVELSVPCGEQPLEGVHTINNTTLTLSAGCAAVGDTLSVTGSGFRPDTPAQLVWQSPIGDFFPLRDEANQFRTVPVDSQGNLSAEFVVPNAIPPGIDASLPQEQRLYVRQSRTIGGFGFSFESCRAQLDSSYPPPQPGPGYELSVNGCFVVYGIYQTITLALMATTLGTLLAIPVSFLAARNLMSANPLTLALYVIMRTILNIVRSIESLIIAIIFVIIVGLGPFAGMLAVTVHTIAALAKLFSELIEGIDPGPIEAMQAVGANWLQVIRYGVVPQVVPPFTAFTIYRLEINVRASTIVGLVGGGGIGFFLIQWINLSDFRAVSASFIAILIIVVFMDQLSAQIRKRLA